MPEIIITARPPLQVHVQPRQQEDGSTVLCINIGAAPEADALERAFVARLKAAPEGPLMSALRKHRDQEIVRSNRSERARSIRPTSGLLARFSSASRSMSESMASRFSQARMTAPMASVTKPNAVSITAIMACVSLLMSVIILLLLLGISEPEVSSRAPMPAIDSEVRHA